VIDRAHAEGIEPVREDARHGEAVRKDVGDAAGGTQVVLQHEVAPVAVADEVAADDVDVAVVGDIDADDLAPEVAGADDEAAGHDAIVQDLLVVVDVVDEAVEGFHALGEAGFDDRPFVRRDEAGDGIEGEDAFRALGRIRVDGEGYALMEEGAAGEVVGGVEVVRAKLGEVGDEGVVVGADAERAVPVGREDLVEEPFGAIAGAEFAAEGLAIGGMGHRLSRLCRSLVRNANGRCSWNDTDWTFGTTNGKTHESDIRIWAT